MPHYTFRRAERGDLSERVYLTVRDAILAGRLPPGTPLSRRKLAEEFHVSPLPAATALDRLEAEGFIESRPRAGTRVKVPTPDVVRGNYILREALETHSARLFAATATPAQRQRLLRMAAVLDARHSALARRPKYDPARHMAFEKTHVAFHIWIARSTGCRELCEAIERSRVLLFNWLFSASGALEPLPPGWHGTLAAEMAEYDPAAAAEAMRSHVRFRIEDAIRHVEELAVDSTGGRITRGPRNQAKSLARTLAS